MNQTQDITASISSFHLPLTPRNLNKTDGSDGSLSTLAREIQEDTIRARENVQGVTSHPSEPSETAPSLPADCVPWLAVAQQVLAGEFDGCDRSTAESLRIGLHRIPHPICREALACLQAKAKTKNNP